MNLKSGIPVGQPVSREGDSTAGTGGAAGTRPQRRYRLSPKRRASAKALAARRANIAKAHAADKDDIFRSTPRRRAASRRNIQKAIAWRRSPEGNAVARLNAFKHGLAVKRIPEILTQLGEGPLDWAAHRQLVRRVFMPETETEWELVERLARATWRRLRIFRARARLESLLWQRWFARTGGAARLSHEAITARAIAIVRRHERAHQVESESYALEDRIERILEALIRERARNDSAYSILNDE